MADARPTESLELDDIHVIDMTDTDYEGILGGGYTIRKHQMNCGEVPFDNECRFGWLQN